MISKSRKERFYMKQIMKAMVFTMCCISLLTISITIQAQESIHKMMLPLQGIDLEQGIIYDGITTPIEPESSDIAHLEFVDEGEVTENSFYYDFDSSADFQIEYDVEHNMLVIIPLSVMGIALFEGLSFDDINQPLAIDGFQLTVEPIQIPLEFAHQVIVWTAENHFFQIGNLLSSDSTISFDYALITTPEIIDLSESELEVTPEPEITTIPEVTPKTTPNAVPEPSTGILLGLGLLTVIGISIKIRRKKNFIKFFLFIIFMGITSEVSGQAGQTVLLIDRAKALQYDADKTYKPKDGIPMYDRNFCWAAVASNLLYWSGYTNAGIQSSQDIFNKFKEYWKPPLSECKDATSYTCYGGGGSSSEGIAWWLKTEPARACSGASCAVRIKSNGGYYQKPISYTSPSGISDSNLIVGLKKKIDGGYGVALGITGSKTCYNKKTKKYYTCYCPHVVTTWGYKTDSSGSITHIYFTDSDDHSHGTIKEVPVVKKGSAYYLSNYTVGTYNKYSNFYIRAVAGFKGKQAPTPQYTITIKKSGNGKGSVTGQGINCGSDCTTTYLSGDNLDLKAIPDSNSIFVGWLFNGVAFTGTKKVNTNGTVTAIFEEWGHDYPKARDPHETGCDRDAVTLGESAPIKSLWGSVVAYLEVRYSSSCNTVWARIASQVGDKSLLARIGDCTIDDYYYDTWDSWGTVAWSPMLDYTPGHTYKAQGRIHLTVPDSIPEGETACHSRDNIWTVPRTISLRSYNYPTYFIAHSSGLGEIIIPMSNFDKQNSTFKMVNGLANTNAISFESINYPGYYLRHENSRIKLSPISNDDLFKKDATFKPVPGLANNKRVSFESVNYPGYYIRHAYGHLYINQGTDDLFRQDATFEISSPNWTTTITPTPTATPTPTPTVTLTPSPIVTITPTPTPNFPVKNGQAWKGTYSCSQGATNLTVQILDVLPLSSSKLSVKGMFNFNYQNKAIGSFYLNGEYLVSTRQLSFQPGAWIKQPTGYSTVGMNGSIASSGTRYQGTIADPDCGAFDLYLQ